MKKKVSEEKTRPFFLTYHDALYLWELIVSKDVIDNENRQLAKRLADVLNSFDHWNQLTEIRFGAARSPETDEPS